MNLRQGNGLMTGIFVPTCLESAFIGLKDQGLREQNCPEPPIPGITGIWHLNKEKRFF